MSKTVDKQRNIGSQLEIMPNHHYQSSCDPQSYRPQIIKSTHAKRLLGGFDPRKWITPWIDHKTCKWYILEEVTNIIRQQKEIQKQQNIKIKKNIDEFCDQLEKMKNV